jgi:hypothetical protein
MVFFVKGNTEYSSLVLEQPDPHVNPRRVLFQTEMLFWILMHIKRMRIQNTAFSIAHKICQF